MHRTAAVLALSSVLAGACMLRAASFDVRAHGARGDGTTSDTAAVQAAVDAAGKAGGGEVTFPAGTYLCGTIRLRSTVTLHLGPGATILTSPADGDFAEREKLDYDSHADQETTCFRHALLAGEGLEGVAIEGQGTIDGNRSKRGGPKPIALKRCRGVTIRGIIVKNAPNYSISLLGCEHVVIDAVTVLNGFSDGIDPDCCRDVRISSCFVDSWDDAICLKTSLALGSREPTEDVVVTSCSLSSSCNAFKLGTESSGDFRGIAVSGCTIFRRPGSRPAIAGVALNAVDGATIDGLVVSNIVMRDVDTPVFVRLGNRGRGQSPPAPGAIRNVSIAGIAATGARFPCSITGQPGHPAGGIRLDGIQIAFRGGGPAGKGLDVPEVPADYPDARMFGELPSFALYCRHAMDVSLRDVEVTLESADPRPAIVADDAVDLELDGFRVRGAPAGEPPVWLNDVEGAWIRGRDMGVGEKRSPRVTGTRSRDIRVAGEDLAPRTATVRPGPPPSASLVPMRGAVMRYTSRLYGDEQPFAICASDLSTTPKPLIVDLIPGTLGGLERAARDCEVVCAIAREKGRDCVALRPCGRGNGSVYQGYGEVDVYEAIDAARKLVAIDPDRVTVTGSSMGGAATWYHASHYPDVWAAAAPFCGYCDYKLWEKPGGTTFHRQEWEETSWISRDAAYRVENFRHVPVRITHGEWDRAVGGGVPVEHSRQMDAKLTALGYPHVYVEVPKTGHGCRTPELWRETVAWLLDRRREADPKRVSLVVHTLRHNRSAWVEVEQQTASGQPSRVEAEIDAEAGRVTVTTENVLRLTLGPIPRGAAMVPVIDGGALAPVDLTSVRSFTRGPIGEWSPSSVEIPAGEKRHGLSGPFGDIFFEPVVVVYGASGSDAETEYNRIMARNAVRFFNEQNGGVHRGGIQGDNAVDIPIASDRDAEGVPAELLARANLFLIGNARSNALIGSLAGDLGIRYGDGSIEVRGETFRGDRVAFYAVLPHPDGKRYVALLSGVEPDAITWGSHVGLQLLPDYLVFNRGEVVKWGFWGNAWR